MSTDETSVRLDFAVVGPGGTLIDDSSYLI